jgi:MFS family permease
MIEEESEFDRRQVTSQQVCDAKTTGFISQCDAAGPASPEMRGKSAELASLDHKPNVGKIWLFLFVATSFTLASNYQGSLNQIKRLLTIKFDWNDKQEIWLYSTLSGIKSIGGCVGAVVASKLLNYFGRRKTVLIVGVIYILANGLFQVMDFWALFFAKLIAGLGSGISTVSVNRMIEEYVPLAMYSTASPFNIFMGQTGVFLALLSALALPAEDADEELYAQNTSWRYMFGFAYVFVAFGMIGFLCCVRTDTPKFYLMNGNEPGALQAIHTIYKTNGSPIQANRIMSFLQKSCNQNVAKISPYDALFGDERYVRACWVNIIVMSFHVLTGYSAVMSFSNTIFTKA